MGQLRGLRAYLCPHVTVVLGEPCSGVLIVAPGEARRASPGYEAAGQLARAPEG